LGGLGIWSSRLQNTFLLGKVVWNMLHFENNLCISLLEIKYFVLNSCQNRHQYFDVWSKFSRNQNQS